MRYLCKVAKDGGKRQCQFMNLVTRVEICLTCDKPIKLNVSNFLLNVIVDPCIKFVNRYLIRSDCKIPYLISAKRSLSNGRGFDWESKVPVVNLRFYNQ